MSITLIILIFSLIFAILSQRKKIPTTHITSGSLAFRYYEFEPLFFVLSFILLTTMCFLSKNGDDIPAYAYYYSNWKLSDLLDLSFEIGYKILCILLHLFVKNPYIGLGIIKFLSLALFYQAIYLLRDKINIGFAVFSYICILYVHSFHLLRIMLAVGIIYVAYAYIILNKPRIGLILIFSALFFHYSSVIVLLAYFIYFFIRKSLSLNKLLVISGILLFIFLNVELIVNFSINQLDILSKYTLYISTVEKGSGLAQLLLFLPLICIIITLNKTDMYDTMYIFCSIIGIMTFFAGSLGYIFEVIGRTTYYFYFFIIIFGASMPLRKDRVYINAGFMVINLRTFLSFLYVLMYIGLTYIIPGKSIEILTDYEFFWS